MEVTGDLTQEQAAAQLAEAQAYLRELQEEHADATPAALSEAQRAVKRCQMAYYMAAVEDSGYEQDYLAEMAEWDATLLDGLEDDGDWDE